MTDGRRLPDLPFTDHNKTAAGPALILVHALGGDRRMWTEFVAALIPPRRAVAVDLFGAGEAPLLPQPPTLTDHVAALSRLIDRLEVEQIVPVGCAVGSMVACVLAAQLGDRAPALILANPILRITAEASEALIIRAKKARSGGIEAILDEVVTRGFRGLPDTDRSEAFAKILSTHQGRGYADLALSMIGCDVAAEARAVSGAVLLVSGESDAVLPSWHVTELAGMMRNARVRFLPGASHFLPQQTPRPFAQMVSSFLEGALHQRG